MDLFVPSQNVHSYPNKKLWVNSAVHQSLGERNDAFNHNNIVHCKHSRNTLQRAIKEEKDHYRKELENKIGNLLHAKWITEN